MTALVVDILAQVAAQLVREASHMPQRRTQIVRYRITEGLQFAVHFRHLLDLAFQLAVQRSDLLLRGLLQ
ncbi:hypothetical protein D9M68_981650 [compost metagenome]